MDRTMIEESGLYQNMNNGVESQLTSTDTKHENVADNSQSRRVSSIYEEILDFKERYDE